MGTSRTTLVGRFERKESDTFLITFSIRFCLFSKVLNGGFTYMFFPVKSCLKKSCFAPNTLSSGYSENHSFRLDEWCSTSAIPSISRQKCFCSKLRRDGGVAQQFLSSQECLLFQLSSKAPVYAFPEVRKGFVSVIFISFPVIFDKLLHFLIVIFRLCSSDQPSVRRHLAL